MATEATDNGPSQANSTFKDSPAISKANEEHAKIQRMVAELFSTRKERYIEVHSEYLRKMGNELAVDFIRDTDSDCGWRNICKFIELSAKCSFYNKHFKYDAPLLARIAMPEVFFKYEKCTPWFSCRSENTATKEKMDALLLTIKRIDTYVTACIESLKIYGSSSNNNVEYNMASTELAEIQIVTRDLIRSTNTPGGYSNIEIHLEHSGKGDGHSTRLVVRV